MVGLLIGGMLPFLFSALAMGAVERAAAAMIVEVRRQFKEIKGLLEGKEKADYARCVDISTAAAIKEMIFHMLYNINYQMKQKLIRIVVEEQQELENQVSL